MYSIEKSFSEDLLLSELRGGSKDALTEFKDSEPTPERLLAVAEGYWSLKLIPKKNQTPELCLIMIKKDASNICHVSRKILTADFCLMAAKENGNIVRWIDESLITSEIADLAVSYDGTSLRSIPQNLITEEMCWKAIRSDGCAIQYVPGAYITEEMIKEAVRETGLALEFIPKKRRTKAVSLIAIRSDGASLQFVPRRFVSEEWCKIALANNPIALMGVPEEMKTEGMCSDCLRRSVMAVDAIPEEWFRKPVIRKAAYDTEVMSSVKKEYRDGIFYVVEKVQCGYRKLPFSGDTEYISSSSFEIETKFDSFDEFRNYLWNDLSGADLSHVEFDGYDLTGCVLDGARIPHVALASQKLGGSALYGPLVKKSKSYVPNSLVLQNEAVSPETVFHVSDFHSNDVWGSDKIFYISDLHLDIKLIKQFSYELSDLEIRNYIHDKILLMTAECSKWNTLLILGDVSFSFSLSKVFYEELSKVWNPKYIIVVLGNHELWGAGMDAGDVDGRIAAYRKMLDSLGIVLLQNDMLVDGQLVTEEMIMDSDIETLRNACIKRNRIILGGIGFSGYCKDFNAANGIYNGAMDLKEEEKRTKRFEKIYLKLKDALGKKQIVVATHMPKTSWSKDKYCPAWVYASGHTHKNEYYEGATYSLFADNQVGYKRKTFGLKHFRLSSTYDVFTYYEDGLYQIKRSEYIDFYRGIGQSIEFNRTGGIILMLKREGFYLFLFRSTEGQEKLYLLAGGTLKKLERNDEQYYFERMIHYSRNINLMMDKYNKAIKTLSRMVKCLGGIGTVHGCIVDLDFYSHIYLNPIDGTVTPYYAESISRKWVYGSVRELLETHCPGMLKRVSRVDHEIVPLLDGAVMEDAKSAVPQYITDTSMYEPSRIIKALQYTTDGNVIRTWYEKLDRDEYSIHTTANNYHVITKDNVKDN